MKEIDCDNMETYVEGYSDCIDDLDALIPTTEEMSCIELLNSYIIAMHILGINKEKMQDKLKQYEEILADECCSMCGDCLECEDDCGEDDNLFDEMIDEMFNALEKSGFTVLRGGK